MVKVNVINVYQPNIFLGTDLVLYDKITQCCNEIKNGQGSLLPSCEIFTNNMYLYEFNNKMIRVRVLEEINSNTFRCLLIDQGRIEEIKKHRMYVIPNNLLHIDPAVKLFKIPGIKPVGLNISCEGTGIKAKLSECSEWIRASYKFVCHIFQENSNVNVYYLKECSKDKALVDVFVSFKNERKNLKDLLIGENYAFAVDEEPQQQMQAAMSSLSLATEDDGSESLVAESISVILDQLRDDDDNASEIVRKIEIPEEPPLTESCDSMSTNRATPGTLDEISMQVLNNKVKSWLVAKRQDVNDNDEVVIKYEYRSPVRPILSYQQDQMIAPFIKDTMLTHKTKSLLLIQALMLPTVLRGLNLVALAPPGKGKSTGLLMPILQRLATRPVSRTRSFNPRAIILCSSWRKVCQTAEAARFFLASISDEHLSAGKQRPRVVAAHAGSVERRVMIPVLEGCDLMVATPRCLLRLLTAHEFFRLDELEMLALDDAEDLIAHHLESLRAVFVYKRSGAAESGLEVQVAATATCWTAGLQSFVQNEMGSLFMLTVNNPLEIAVFERLKQKLVEYDGRVAGGTDLYGRLQSLLEMTEAGVRRTVVCASDDRRVAALHQVLVQKAGLDLRVMIGSMTAAQLRLVEKEWNQHRGLVNMPVLLISDEALGGNDVSIFNAHTILHADINPATFGTRLNFLRDMFQHLSFLDQPQATLDSPLTPSSSSSPSLGLCHSYIFVCPATIDLSHADFLYRFLGRCHCDRPQWLQEKAVDYVLNKEKAKVVNEICHQVKATGCCQAPACTRRHIVLPDVDKPLLPNRGQIKFRLLHLLSPSHFYVRILEHKVAGEDPDEAYKTRFTGLRMALMRHFADRNNIQGVNQKIISPGLVAAVRQQDLLERVQVVRAVPGSRMRVEVRLLDLGGRMTLERADLLALPASLSLAAVPPQAVEVFVTGVRPLDNDPDYLEEAKQFARSFLEDRDLYAVVTLCIGNTLWLDSVTQLVHHKNTRISVYEKSIAVELVEREFADKNVGHVNRLVRLCTGKVDVWTMGQEPEARPRPIMRRFTYVDDDRDRPLRFESLPLQCADLEDDFASEIECTLVRVVQEDLMVLSVRDTRESIRQMEREIEGLVGAVEEAGRVEAGARVLYEEGPGQWRRGLVLRLIDGQEGDGGHGDQAQVEMFSLDWGQVGRAHLTGLRRLPREYLEEGLPCHLVLARLSDLSAPAPGQGGALAAAIDHFCGGRPLLATAKSAQPLSQALLDLLAGGRPVPLGVHEVALASGDEAREALIDSLLRARLAVPSLDWVHTVLPEAAPHADRIARLSSPPHLAADLLCGAALPADRRLLLAQSIERVVLANVALYEQRSSAYVGFIDGAVNSVLVLAHFLQEPPLFMCLYRALTAVASLAYHCRPALDGTRGEQELTIGYVCGLVYSYQGLVGHLLGHLGLLARLPEGEEADLAVLLGLLKTLLVDSSFVGSLLEEAAWPAVLAGVAARLRECGKPLCLLMEVAVQLAVLERGEGASLAGLLDQAVLALEASREPSVWAACLALLSSLVLDPRYAAMMRERRLPEVLLPRAVEHLRESGGLWGEGHEAALGLLAMLGVPPGSGHLLEDLRALGALCPPSCVETLARLAAQAQTPAEAPQGERAAPDADADEWAAPPLLRRHRRARARLFKDQEDCEDGDLSSGSREYDQDSSSDVEVTPFLNDDRNPADEDNVLCYDRQ